MKATMGIDGELAGVLRELVQFLECLREIKLPVALESVRDNLLIRSKDTLTAFTAERMARPNSPEPYLNMNIGPKSLLGQMTDSELQEYVGAENQTEKQHDYYETFQLVDQTNASTLLAAKVPQDQDDEDEGLDENEKPQIDRILCDIYAKLSATQTKITCQKCGQLSRKEGKKLFVFEQYRACWVGLVGSHLLIYANEKESRPCSIQAVRGYVARAAPNAVPRDHRKSESAFEIVRPGNRTLQFLATTPKEMEDWVAKINQVRGGDSDEFKNRKPLLDLQLAVEAAEDSSKLKEERYQDVEALCADRTCDETSNGSGSTKTGEPEASTSKDALPEVADPPPLPARIPRRLPSLPAAEFSREPGCPADDEEDDIYHKIEDLKDSICYQNLVKEAKKKISEVSSEAPATYDDVRATAKDRTVKEDKLKESRNIDKAQTKSTKSETTYDDIASKKDDKTGTGDAQSTVTSYDDVENLIQNIKSAKSQRTEKVAESPHKKSFLERVRSRRESPRKSEKKIKSKTPTPPPVAAEEITTYDDVTDLISAEDVKPLQELAEYNCPPPPRPVYVKPAIDLTESQEIYDDVNAGRDKSKDEESGGKSDQFQRIPGTLNIHGCSRVDEKLIVRKTIEQQLLEDCEHYQTPRNELCERKPVVVEQQEELYDDIAILADFTSRQRESLDKKEAEDSRLPNSPEKKPWNRFVSCRKSKLTETAETNGQLLDGNQDADDVSHQHGVIRMNTFQKLISKMENSLGKASGKTAPSMSLSKTNVTNNV